MIQTKNYVGINSRAILNVLNQIKQLVKYGKNELPSSNSIQINCNLAITSIIFSNSGLNIEYNINGNFKNWFNPILIDFKEFYNIVKNLNSEFYLKVIESDLVIYNDNFQATITGITQENKYKPVEIFNQEFRYTFETDDLKQKIKETINMLSIDEKNKILSNLFLEFDNNICNFVAIDGFRMSISSLSTNKNVKNRFLINAEILKVLKNSKFNNTILITNKDTIFFVSNTDNEQLIISFENLKYEYLNYRKFIPLNHDQEIKFDRKELLTKLKKLDKLAKGDTKKFPTLLNITKDKLIITSYNKTSKFTDDIKIDGGKKFEIGFNISYLILAIKDLKSNDITIKFPDIKVLPITIHSISNINMVLPVRY